jgi:hypothetical protein
MIMDNNLFAVGHSWQVSVMKWFPENDIKMLSPQGWDARLLTSDRAELLWDIDHAGGIHFAWDNMQDEGAVIEALVILERNGFNLRRDIAFYVLVGFNTTIEQDIYRCQKLKEWGTNAFVMPYKKSREINKLARWANRKQLFWQHDFKDDNYKEFRK